VSATLGLLGTLLAGQMVHGLQPPGAGVTAFDSADSEPVPTALVAVTRNVYAVPLVNPVTVVVVAGGLPVTVLGACAVVPTYGVTVYPVIALPPFAGAVQDTTAEVSPATAPTPVGTPGTVEGVGMTEFDAVESGPVPTGFVAETRNVYAVPLVSPVTVVVVAGGLPLNVVGSCAALPM
jgi:hypothetical protein